MRLDCDVTVFLSDSFFFFDMNPKERCRRRTEGRQREREKIENICSLVVFLLDVTFSLFRKAFGLCSFLWFHSAEVSLMFERTLKNQRAQKDCHFSFFLSFLFAFMLSY